MPSVKEIEDHWDDIADDYFLETTDLTTMSLAETPTYGEIDWSSSAFQPQREVIYHRHEKMFNDLDIKEGEFTCPKCRHKRASYFQLQTRSSDEPMTTFLKCLNRKCRNRWRE